MKELCPVISHPLMLIFNKSLEEGMFPDLMKQVDTIPLYKAKSTEDGKKLPSYFTSINNIQDPRKIGLQ